MKIGRGRPADTLRHAFFTGYRDEGVDLMNRRGDTRQHGALRFPCTDQNGGPAVEMLIDGPVYRGGVGPLQRPFFDVGDHPDNLHGMLWIPIVVDTLAHRWRASEVAADERLIDDRHPWLGAVFVVPKHAPPQETSLNRAEESGADRPLIDQIGLAVIR